MTDPTLLELVKEVRWKTLKLLETVSEAQALFVPAGLANHVLWHAGHSLVVVEGLACGSLAATALGEAPPFPRGWIDLFRGGSDPATVATWPALGELVAALKDQRTRLLGLLEKAGEQGADLDRVVGPAPRNRTLRGMIVHALHDEAGHQGEIHLLKKLAALPV
ncbi:MAG: hypothetical protein JWM57_1614 [Phycisphaerales bacterium]|nr:hypothetical protein [Phycisphaerales bacterium]